LEAGVNEVLATFDCKVDGCDGTAYKSSGRYAMLCSFHTQEAREKARLSRYNGDGPIHNLERSETVVGKASHEFRAAGLVALGKQLDEALAAYEEAPIKLEEAQRRWNQAVDSLSEIRH
jgi:N-acetylneuraminic acid mutarotase